MTARIAGVFEAGPVVAEGRVELGLGATVMKLFQQADRALGFRKEKYFHRALASTPTPTVLLNGDRLDLPEGLARTLADGDEISVLTPMFGG
ncbi:MAG: MoaD/ThiS family protein [Thermodesulfobacteriota bacterium]